MIAGNSGRVKALGEGLDVLLDEPGVRVVAGEDLGRRRRQRAVHAAAVKADLDGDLARRQGLGLGRVLVDEGGLEGSEERHESLRGDKISVVRLGSPADDDGPQGGLLELLAYVDGIHTRRGLELGGDGGEGDWRGWRGGRGEEGWVEGDGDDFCYFLGGGHGGIGWRGVMRWDEACILRMSYMMVLYERPD